MTYERTSIEGGIRWKLSNCQGDNVPIYFTNGKILTAAGWEHKKLHGMLQVQSTLSDPLKGRPLRMLMRKYTISKSICVAKGLAVRNGKYGSGGMSASLYFGIGQRDGVAG